jgi:orotidine-5'-phosphate decarboxylase
MPQTTISSGRFSDRLAHAIDALGTPACVGLDPVIEKMPRAVRESDAKDAVKLWDFCRSVIDEVAGIVPVVKPQSACFERYGYEGVTVLKSLIDHAHGRGLIVLLDAKRGDIGVTAEHYAHAAFATSAQGLAGADAVTISGYMGPDTIEPFLAHASAGTESGNTHGVFVLVRTSNPGSDAVQAQKLADGRTVAEMMADMVRYLGQTQMGERGLSDVGAVVGATKSAEAAALRARMPNTVFLIPGYGAQGGTIEDIRPALRAAGSRKSGSAAELGVLVNASRSVLYPKGNDREDWRPAIAEAAREFAEELRALVR